MLFWYFQLGHANNAQFPRSPVVKADSIEELLAPRDLRKPLSSLYGALLCTDLPRMGKLWEHWKGDIPSLDKEGWEDCLEQGPKLVISSRDELIQVKFLHRVYYTPGRLHRSVTLCVPAAKHNGAHIHICFGSAL